MEFTLVLLTHGDAPTLAACIQSAAEMVSPKPSEALCVVDGNGALPPVEPLGPWKIVQNSRQMGFCAATRILWQLASHSEHPYVLCLEHDFLFTREVDLAPLAEVLEAEPRLAQMQLMRDAVNPKERAAGGLFESRFGEYEQRYADYGLVTGDACPHCGMKLSCQPETPGWPCCLHPNYGGCGWWPQPWLRHRSYMTTNVNLMRRQFMAENPWPGDGKPECEGRFGIDLVAKGYSFGVWGDGSPWTRHIGVRDRSGWGY